MKQLWIGAFILCLGVGACEKRKGVLLPPRDTGSKAPPTEDLAHAPAKGTSKEMRAKTLPDNLMEGGELSGDTLTPLSESEAQDLQKVKQDALDRIKKNSSHKLADGAAPKGKASALYTRGRQLVAQGNVEEGQEYYLVACQLGYTEGCHKFGWHEERMGNIANAKQFYKIACEGGLSKSCNNIGFQLEKQHHWDEALDFYARACLEKHSTGCDNLKRLRIERLKLR